MIWLVWVWWHMNHCRLFNAKSSLYIYIKFIWFGLVGFYGLPTLVGYSMPNPLYIYTHIYNLLKHFENNILKQAWALFCTQLQYFKYCYITVTIYHQSFVCTQISSIWPIYGTLSGTTTLGQSDLRAITIKWYSAFPKSSRLGPRHQIV